ncbi:galactokinase [Algoriphagus hitonicola]|uniref:galactokinase n=1 Tax=Algoriphagus hitonicola TaxID=435880 RepID=UPI000B82EFD4|nr:galactokinase [Algoriphagus hitonicola]
MKARLQELFQKTFESTPIISFAPGRINLIGEHTDYQEGFVFPAAVQFGIWVGVQKNQLPYCRLYSMDFEEEFTFDWQSFSPKKGHWSTYVMGFLAQLKQAGYPFAGFDMMIGGDIPVGAGLSSSAALSVSIGTGLSQLFGLKLTLLSISKYAQNSEHQYAGVNCGIMDPYASAFGKKDHALLLDCRSNQHQEITVNLGEYSLLLVNSNVKHSLEDSAYNQRRAACEKSVEILKAEFPEINTLRDLRNPDLNQVEKLLPASLFPKAKHVISECERVQSAADSLQSGDLKSFGKLLNASHQSLSQDYEVSCAELDFLAEKAQNFPGILGSRMMGGGFGGCTINLIETQKISDFQEKIHQLYQEEFGMKPSFISVEISEGARIVS